MRMAFSLSSWREKLKIIASETKSSTATTQATIRLSLSDNVWEIFLVNISVWLDSANIAKNCTIYTIDAFDLKNIN